MVLCCFVCVLCLVLFWVGVNDVVDDVGVVGVGVLRFALLFYGASCSVSVLSFSVFFDNLI